MLLQVQAAGDTNMPQAADPITSGVYLTYGELRKNTIFIDSKVYNEQLMIHDELCFFIKCFFPQMSGRRRTRKEGWLDGIRSFTYYTLIKGSLQLINMNTYKDRNVCVCIQIESLILYFVFFLRSAAP